MTDQRYVLGIAHQAGRDPRITRGADGRRDYFEPDTLEKSAWGFMRSPMHVGTEHADGTEGSAEVVESYIYRGPDWEVQPGIIVKSGDWLVGAILDEPAWNAYRAGRFNGFSIQGRARRRTAAELRKTADDMLAVAQSNHRDHALKMLGRLDEQRRVLVQIIERNQP